jgi:hypothetical protein
MNIRDDVLIKSVERMKAGAFGVTAIKVELEAQLNRRSYVNQSAHCDEDNCEGGRHECDNCGGEGTFDCDDCDGGYYEDDDGDEVECGSCDGETHTTCSHCHGDGYITCPNPTNTDTNERVYNFRNETDCRQWILKELLPLGLSKLDEDGITYVPKLPLKFIKFYNDGSVDSECTFTLMLNDPKNIFLLPKFVDIWNKLAKTIDCGMETQGAGLHMALIRTANGIYPSSTLDTQVVAYKNFKRSVVPLLPALFFLGTNNDKSRAMRFRRPRITCDKMDYDSKYSAVVYRNGAIEFRVFDTCYDNPQAILDNVVVMSNAMRYWSKKLVPNKLEGAVKNMRFGKENGQELERLYMKVEYLDVLNHGLEKLKPSYYTIKEVKEQRKFRINKRYLVSKQGEVRKEAEVSYREYENRLAWNLVQRRAKELVQLIDSQMRSGTQVTEEERARIVAELHIVADRNVQEWERTFKVSLNDHINNALHDYISSTSGEFQLA